MLIKITRWHTVVPQLKKTFRRFPFPIICTLCACIVALLLTFKINIGQDNELLTLFITLFYASIAFTSFKLFVENHGWSYRAHIIGLVILLAIIVLFTWNILVETSDIGFKLFSLSLFSSLLIAPYINKKSTSDSYWYFNYILGDALFIAVIAAAILGSGLSLILLSIDYLFEINILNEFYTVIWIFGSGILFTLYFLSNISKAFDFKKEECDFPQGTRFITNTILVPLIIIYMALLYAYFLKIVIHWQLPRGNLAWIITTFGTVGIVTKLLAYPIRNSGTRLLQLFDKYYYYVLIIPTLLLGVVIGIRINNYGMTESRYIVVLLGLWFSISTILTIIKKQQLHIKYVPMVFALLAFFASFGPWGAFQVSLNSQIVRFESALIQHGLLENGQVIKIKNTLSFTQRLSLSSMADYITQSKTGEAKIRPWFKTLIKNAKINNELITHRLYGAKQLIELMGIEYTGHWKRKTASKNFIYSSSSNNLKSNLFKVNEYDYISAGTVYFHHLYVKDKTFRLTVNDITRTIAVGQQANNIVVKVDESEQLNFDMQQVIIELQKQHITVINSKNLFNLSLMQSTRNKDLNVEILIERITGTITLNQSIDVREVHYIIMLKFKNNNTK